MGVFDGRTFCVSGKFSMSQSALTELLIKNGGSIAATPSKSCSYLVTDSLGSSKTLKAQKDALPIVTEQWVHTSIKENKLASGAALFLSAAASAAAASAAPAAKRSATAKTAAPKRKARAAVRSSDGEAASDEEEEVSEEAVPAPAKRARKATAPAAAATGAGAAPKVGAKGGKVFSGLVFVISGATKLGKSSLQTLLLAHGGSTKNDVTRTCTHCISNTWQPAGVRGYWSGSTDKTDCADGRGLYCVDETWVHASIAAGELQPPTYDNSVARGGGPCGEAGCSGRLRFVGQCGGAACELRCPECKVLHIYTGNRGVVERAKHQ